MDERSEQALASALEKLNVAEEELRSQNEALLAANEMVENEREHYLHLFDTLPDAYVITDEVGIIQEVNPAAEDLLRVNARRLRGKPIAVFVDERDRRRFRATTHDIVHGSHPSDFEAMLRPRGSPLRAVTIRVSQIDTDPARIGWLIRDLSDSEATHRFVRRVEEEHSARVSAERTARRFRFLSEVGHQLTGERNVVEMCRGVTRTVVKFMADHCSLYLLDGGKLSAVASADHEANAADAVDNFNRTHGLNIDNVDSPIWRAILTAEPQAVPELQTRVSENGLKLWLAEIRDAGPRAAVIVPLTRRDQCFGALVVVTLAAQPALTADDVSVLLEVSARASLGIDNAQLFARLQKANTQKSEFLAVMSHELRTPLTAVIGYAELLLAGVPDRLSEGARQQVERIRASAWHQFTIVEQLLNQVRQVPHDETTKRVTVDLHRAITEVVQLVSPAATEKGLTINIDVPATFALTTDPDRLRQILINLLWNAVKYTERGTIGVLVRGSDDAVFISVTDTGPGIDAGALRRIFDRYWRGTSSGSGIGLGLSLSRQLARLLGGEVSVESTLGSGSTFTLKLPLE